MKLTILGSGTVDPRAERASSGYFLDTSAGHVLVDVGNGTLRRAEQFGLPVHDVGVIFLSHLHPDHTADLVPLLFARKYAPAPWGSDSKLSIYGPVGTRSFLDAVFSAWPSVKPDESSFQIEVLELEQQELTCCTLGDFSVRCFPVEHGDMPAFAYRFQDGDDVLAYSGDSKLCSGLFEVAKEAGLFLCECSCFARGCEPLACRGVHLSWEDVAEICVKSKPFNLVLTHLYEPVLASHPNPQESLSKALDIPVELAQDGAVYETFSMSTNS